MEDLIYQGMVGIAGLVFTVVSMELKAYIAKKKSIMGYEFDVEVTERILGKAVVYAEGYAKTYAAKSASKLASSEKMAVAKKYIEMVDPKLVLKLGDELGQMIDRKVTERYA